MKNLLNYVMTEGQIFSMNDIRRILGNTFIINVDEILDTKLITDPTANIIMYLLYYGQRGYIKTMTERDHIFPKAKLTQKFNGRQLYRKEYYDSIKNCELLSTTENRDRKKDLLLEGFFQNFYPVPQNREAFIKLHAIPDDANLWGDLGKFKEFMNKRKPMMAKRIKDSLSSLNIQFITSLE